MAPTNQAEVESQTGVLFVGFVDWGFAVCGPILVSRFHHANFSRDTPLIYREKRRFTGVAQGVHATNSARLMSGPSLSGQSSVPAVTFCFPVTSARPSTVSMYAGSVSTEDSSTVSQVRNAGASGTASPPSCFAGFDRLDTSDGPGGAESPDDDGAA